MHNSYDTGKPSVLQSLHLVKGRPNSKYATTLAFDHSIVSELILMATPRSLYAVKNGPKTHDRIFASPECLTILTDEVKVVKYDNWKTKELESPLTFELNNYLTLVVHSYDKMLLTFKNPESLESFVFSVGFTAEKITDIPDCDVKFLQSPNMAFQSRSAAELAKGNNKVKIQTRNRSRSNLSSSFSKSEQVAKKLGFIDESYVTDCANQVKRLRSKIGWICEAWLGHYCLWLGMLEIRNFTANAPASLMFNKNSARRLLVHSARVANTHSDDEFDLDITTDRKKASKRATSSEARVTEFAIESRSQTPTKERMTERDPSLVISRKSSRAVSPAMSMAPSTVCRTPEPPAAVSVPPPRPPPVSSITDFHIIGVCPSSLRKQMTNGLEAYAPQHRHCHCSRQKPPYVTDIEFDMFITVRKLKLYILTYLNF